MNGTTVARRRSGVAALFALVLATGVLLLFSSDSAQATEPTYQIYGDSLASGWQAVESRSKIHTDNKGPTYEGSASIRVHYIRGDSSALLRTQTPVPAAGYDTVRFAIYGDEPGRAVHVTLLDGQGNATGPATPVEIPYGHWSQVELAVAASAISAIRLDKSGDSSTWSHFYIDEVVLLGAEAEPTPTLQSSPTLASSPTATLTSSDGDDDDPQPSPTSSPTSEPPTATVTATSTATDEAPAPTSTATQPPATATATATSPPPTATPITEPATATAIATATATSKPPTATATATSAPPVESSQGILISPAEIANLPTSGAGWNAVTSWAGKSASSPDLGDQNDQTDAVVVAKALVYVRSGNTQYRDQVVDAVMAAMGTESGAGILAIGRNLAGYVIAADLVGLSGSDDDVFRAWLDDVRYEVFNGAGPSLSVVSCHEKRPNNFGTHCGTSRLAAALYLGDSAEVQRAATVFRGWLGDRSAYAGFNFGSDISWHCDPGNPVGINPANCTIEGNPVSGVLPDDQRRGGSFTWPPPGENYVWEALQGAVAQARILERQGYDTFGWSDQALLRAVTWLHDYANYPASGDDSATPWLINAEYGSGFPADSGARPGKNGLGWYEWFYGG